MILTLTTDNIVSKISIMISNILNKELKVIDSIEDIQDCNILIIDDMFIDINIDNLNNISNIIYITNDTLKNNNHLIISRPFLPTVLINEIKNILENRKDDMVVLEVVEEVKEEKKIIVTLEDKPTKERKKDKEKDKIEKKVIKNNIENENDKDKIEKQVIKNNEEKDKDKNKTKEKEQCKDKVIDNDSDEDESIVSINSLSNIKGSLDKKEIESLKKRLLIDHIKVEPKTTNFDFEAELNDLIDNTILDLNGVNHK
jgi:hypothetical protein